MLSSREALSHSTWGRACTSMPRPMHVTQHVRSNTAVQAFPGFLAPFLGGSTKDQRASKKQALLDLIDPLDRGVSATPAEKEAVDAAARDLEKLSKGKTLSSPLINGKWELLYTTSQSILGIGKPAFLRPSGPIYQIIDAQALKARNQETAPLYNSVKADLEPLSDTKVAVQFKVFRLLNLIDVKAPAAARGELDITYVDEELRVSRGDRGNLFVLRMIDPDEKP